MRKKVEDIVDNFGKDFNAEEIRFMAEEIGVNYPELHIMLDTMTNIYLSVEDNGLKEDQDFRKEMQKVFLTACYSMFCKLMWKSCATKRIKS